MALLRERPGPRRWIGLGVATVGVVLVALRVGVGGPVGAFVLVLGAAAAWALSNMAIRKGAPPNMLRFMVWVSAVATLPLFGLSLALEGAPRVSFDLPLVGALLYIAGISTLAGFAVWGALIRRYEAATVGDELRGAHPARAAAPDRPARRCACRGRPLIWLVTAASVGA